MATPESVEEVSNLVRRAASDQVPVTVRGGGHSQGGQSLTGGGLILDTVRLNRVQDLGPDLIRAQGGALWGRVVDLLEGTGRPGNADLQVGTAARSAADGVDPTRFHGRQVRDRRPLASSPGGGRHRPPETDETFNAANAWLGFRVVVTA